MESVPDLKNQVSPVENDFCSKISNYGNTIWLLQVSETLSFLKLPEIFCVRHLNDFVLNESNLKSTFDQCSVLQWPIFMPCPFTGPKMFWTGPNILSQTKNWIVFSATPKKFALPLKMNLLNANHFLPWHKKFGNGSISK